MALVVKNLPANAGDMRDAGSIPGWGRSPGGGHDNPLQYSCLENPMDRGAWWATVHGIAQSRTRLKQLSTHACNVLHMSTLCSFLLQSSSLLYEYATFCLSVPQWMGILVISVFWVL